MNKASTVSLFLCVTSHSVWFYWDGSFLSSRTVVGLMTGQSMTASLHPQCWFLEDHDSRGAKRPLHGIGQTVEETRVPLFLCDLKFENGAILESRVPVLSLCKICLSVIVIKQGQLKKRNRSEGRRRPGPHTFVSCSWSHLCQQFEYAGLLLYVSRKFHSFSFS